jgi:hypothetical protein
MSRGDLEGPERIQRACAARSSPDDRHSLILSSIMRAVYPKTFRKSSMQPDIWNKMDRFGATGMTIIHAQQAKSRLKFEPRERLVRLGRASRSGMWNG